MDIINYDLITISNIHHIVFIYISVKDGITVELLKHLGQNSLDEITK